MATYWYSIGDTIGEAPADDAILKAAGNKKEVTAWLSGGINYNTVKGVTVDEGLVGSQMFNAVYGEAATVNLTFSISESDHEKGAFAGGSYETMITELEPGTSFTAPEPKANTGWKFTGWQDENGNSYTGIVPDANTVYTAGWEKINDENGDGIDDSEQFRVVFDLGQDSGGVFELENSTKVTVSEDKTVATYWYNVGDAVGPAPSNDVIKNVLVNNWKSGGIDYTAFENTVLDDFFAGKSQTFKAEYDEDKNNDDIPDADQPHVLLQPYDTTVYSGGANSDDESGFPDLELELTDEGRQVDNSAVNSVTINGYTFKDTTDNDIDLNTFLKAMYVYIDENGNYQQSVSDNDDDYGNYLTVIAVRSDAIDAFEGHENYYIDNGLIRNSDNQNRIVTIGTGGELSSIGVGATYEDGRAFNYYVNINNGSLYVRQVNNESVYREIVNDEADVDTNESKLAGAVVSDTTTFLTNGDPDRVIDEDSVDDIMLLVDDVKTDNGRIDILKDKAYNDAYGIDTDKAEAEGYSSVLKYFDLVDSGNGNAWVQSTKGTDVYMPYPNGTDENTEFTIRYFVGLDRDKQYDGDDAVREAIEDAPLEDEVELQLENTPYGIRFYTTGEHAFSPFMLMWKTEDASSDDNKDDDDHGNGNTDSNTPGAGPGASGSTYTAGVHGNWVHVDPANIFAPITSPVPEGATPVTAPEWHQWKFILNNGAMLYDQWAYVKNPYAVDGQPKEGWFSFDNDGIMEYGWYLDENTGKWYWMHRDSDGMLGTMETGWHYDDQDGKWYYLNPDGGEMLLGWQQIGSAWYYFNPYAPEITWHYDEATGGWTWNGSASRPYGSMYRNEMTPDGYFVDENGAWRN